MFGALQPPHTYTPTPTMDCARETVVPPVTELLEELLELPELLDPLLPPLFELLLLVSFELLLSCCVSFALLLLLSFELLFSVCAGSSATSSAACSTWGTATAAA